MHPELLKIGSFTIHTYGFMVAMGFLAGVFVVRRLSVRSGLPAEKIVDLTFWLLVAGFVGARILFVLTRWEYFSSDWMAVFRVWEGGLVFFGGLIAALAFGIWYCRGMDLPLWKVMDVIIPGLVLGHAFGRGGCFFAGCCYGRPTDGPLGVRFYSELVDSALRGIPLHPTQVYEAVALLMLFVGLLVVFKKKVFDGQVALTYLICYPIIRSVIEVYRGDSIRGFVIEGILSTSQFISILVFIAALVTLVLRSRAVREDE